LRELLRFNELEPDVAGYYERTYVPTESYFPSVARWLLGEDVDSRPLHFMHFSGAAHPRLLTQTDLKAIDSSGAFFARKFVDSSTWLDDLASSATRPASK
jgi:hypothetical protein